MQVNLTAVHIAEGRPPGDPALAYFATGGGFSNYFRPPSYQAKNVARYLAANAPDVPSYAVNSDASNVGANGGVYNRIGRGYPDVRHSHCVLPEELSMLTNSMSRSQPTALSNRSSRISHNSPTSAQAWPRRFSDLSSRLSMKNGRLQARGLWGSLIRCCTSVSFILPFTRQEGGC